MPDRVALVWVRTDRGSVKLRGVFDLETAPRFMNDLPEAEAQHAFSTEHEVNTGYLAMPASRGLIHT